MVPHVVYLAITTHLKVGVTGLQKTLTRWSDQGALQATIIARTPNRRLAGEIEHALSTHFSDRTNWRNLLTGKTESSELAPAKHNCFKLIPQSYRQYISHEEDEVHFSYPVRDYLTKARTLSLDKEPLFQGVLQGIRGQYLLLGQRGFNLRRHSGYLIDFELVE